MNLDIYCASHNSANGSEYAGGGIILLYKDKTSTKQREFSYYFGAVDEAQSLINTYQLALGAISMPLRTATTVIYTHSTYLDSLLAKIDDKYVIDHQQQVSGIKNIRRWYAAFAKIAVVVRQASSLKLLQRAAELAGMSATMGTSTDSGTFDLADINKG